MVTLVLARTAIAIFPNLATWLILGTCGFLVAYPFFELLYLGRSERGAVMEYQGILERLIRHGEQCSPPRTYVVAVGVFVALFVLPPLIIAQVLSLPIVVAGLSWFLVPPIVILSFYGSKGTTPPLLEFKIVGNRSIGALVRGMVTILSLGFVCYSVASRTLTLMYGSTQGAADIFSSLTMPVIAGYAVYGFFSRYWRAELKTGPLDIIFSGYLFIAIAVNVMVNSLAFASQSLEPVIGWTFTSVFIEHHSLMIPITMLGSVGLILFTLKDLASSQERTKIKLSLMKKATRSQNGETLSTLLEDRDWKIRYEAVRALFRVVKIAPRKVPVQPLIDALEDVQWEVCAEAAEALGEIGAGEPGRVPIEPLRAALEHDLYNVTMVVERALCRIEQGSKTSPKTVERFPETHPIHPLEKPRDIDSYVRDVANDALRDICEPMYMWPPRENHAYFRYGIDKILTKLSELPLEEVIRPLVDALKDESILQRRIAADALRKIGRVVPGMVPIKPVIEGLRKEPIGLFRGVRIAVAELLADIGKAAPEEMVVPLIETLKDEDFRVRCGVALALGEIAKAIPDKRATIVSALETVYHKHKDTRIGDVLEDLK